MDTYRRRDRDSPRPCVVSRYPALVAASWLRSRTGLREKPGLSESGFGKFHPDFGSGRGGRVRARDRGNRPGFSGGGSEKTAQKSGKI